MKLTKPPEKKTPVGPGSKPAPATKPPPKKTQTTKNLAQGVDILDLDFNSMSMNDPIPTSSGSDPMDLLGGSTPSQPQNSLNNNFDLFNSAPTTTQQTAPVQNTQNFSFDSFSKQPQSTISVQNSQNHYQQQSQYTPPTQNLNMGQVSNNINNNTQVQPPSISIQIQQVIIT